MKERPILFSAHEVRATLDGRQTQVRRIVKHPIPSNIKSVVPYSNKQGNLVYGWSWGVSEKLGAVTELVNMKCLYGKPGDRLWVRETWQGPLFYGEIPYDWNSDKYKNPEYCYYRASGHSCDFTDADDNHVERWSPSIHMPRWASRILLEVVNVRVERLNDISEDDAVAEGVEPWVIGEGLWRDYSLEPDQEEAGSPPMTSARDSYKTLWESLNGPGSWDLNPWVWMVEFKPLEIARAAA